MRILIVDDHEVVREGLVGALSSEADREIVGVASTAEEGIRRAKQTLPDVALIDLRLPDMGGVDLCRRMRANFPSMAIVILTSYLSEDVVRDAIAAGATGYVTKSAGLTELRRVLGELDAAPTGSRPEGASQIVEQLHRVGPDAATAARARTRRRGPDQRADRGATVHLRVDGALSSAEAQGQARRPHEDRTDRASDSQRADLAERISRRRGMLSFPTRP
jgi:DNA-binding NarL/FixJ family response regulator